MAGVAADRGVAGSCAGGELEQEGAENVFMSELGWATYLDEKAGSSYNMNERPSKASDGYFTPDVFSNPLPHLDVVRAPGLHMGSIETSRLGAQPADCCVRVQGV